MSDFCDEPRCKREIDVVMNTGGRKHALCEEHWTRYCEGRKTEYGTLRKSQAPDQILRDPGQPVEPVASVSVKAVGADGCGMLWPV